MGEYGGKWKVIRYCFHNHRINPIPKDVFLFLTALLNAEEKVKESFALFSVGEYDLAVEKFLSACSSLTPAQKEKLKDDLFRLRQEEKKKKREDGNAV